MLLTSRPEKGANQQDLSRFKNVTFRQFTSQLLLFSLTLAIVITSSGGVQAALKKCNFDRYLTGCYSQANFECDLETNLCKCHPQTPVLIDDRFCVKKSQSHEISRVIAEVDIGSSQDDTQANGSARAQQGAGQRHEHESSDDDNNNNNNKQSAYSHTTHSGAASGGNNNINHHNYNHPNHHHNTNGSILPRLVWIFLILTLLALIALLFLIKFQSYRTERPFHLQEDRRSISSELEAPPPYETAIRMKL